MTGDRSRRLTLVYGTAAFVVTLALVLVGCGGDDDQPSDAMQGTPHEPATGDASGDESAAEDDDDDDDLSEGVEFTGTLTWNPSLRGVDLSKGAALRVSVEPMDYGVFGLEVYVTAASGPVFDLWPSYGEDVRSLLSDNFGLTPGEGGADLFTDVYYASSDALGCEYGSSVDSAIQSLGVPLLRSGNNGIYVDADFGLDDVVEGEAGGRYLGFGGTTNDGHTPAWLSFVAPADGKYNVIVKARDSGCSNERYGDFRVRMQTQQAPDSGDGDVEGESFDESGFGDGGDVASPAEMAEFFRFHFDFLTDADFFPVDLLYSDLYSDIDIDLHSDSYRSGGMPDERNPNADKYYGPPRG